MAEEKTFTIKLGSLGRSKLCDNASTYFRLFAVNIALANSKLVERLFVDRS